MPHPVTTAVIAAVALLGANAAIAQTPKPTPTKVVKVKPTTAPKPTPAVAAKPAPRPATAKTTTPAGRMVSTKTSTGKAITYNCTKAGNANKKACK